MSDGAPQPFTLARRLAAEAVGTAMLLATVVGSGIMGESLSGGIVGVALMANAVATGAILIVLILMFGPVSGAHFNPAVTLAFLMRREIGSGDAAFYVVVQVVAALAGVVVAHLMFGQPLVQVSAHARGGVGELSGEVIATFALVGAILACLRWRPEAVPYAVGLVITAGYWYTSSTSFANPAVTLARAFTNTFSGIAPAGVLAFIAAELVGAVAATLFFGWLFARGGAAD